MKQVLPDSLWRLIGVLQRHLEEADWEVFVHLGGDPQPGVCDCVIQKKNRGVSNVALLEGFGNYWPHLKLA